MSARLIATLLAVAATPFTLSTPRRPSFSG